MTFAIVCSVCGQRWLQTSPSLVTLQSELEGHRTCWKGRHGLSGTLFSVVDIVSMEEKRNGKGSERKDTGNCMKKDTVSSS
jgi:hypothetical protein